MSDFVKIDFPVLKTDLRLERGERVYVTCLSIASDNFVNTTTTEERG